MLIVESFSQILQWLSVFFSHAWRALFRIALENTDIAAVLSDRVRQATLYYVCMATDPAFDARAFRNALGHFATGVTIITAADEQQNRVGVTANSFSSVSLNPPLVLWSLDKKSGTLPIYVESEYFIVNILADNQIELSNHFARPGVEDKFAGLDVHAGISDVPMIPECAAYFQCQKRFTYEGGDHLIFVGEVLDFHATKKSGLLYHQGQYAVSERHPQTGLNGSASIDNSFVQGYLDYLLSQTASAFEKQFQEELDRSDVSRYEWRILSCVSEYAGRGFDELAALTIIEHERLETIVKDMVKKNWLRMENDEQVSLFVEEAGMQKLVPLMASAKAHEASVMVDYSSAERDRLKAILQSILRRMNEPLFQLVEADLDQGQVKPAV